MIETMLTLGIEEGDLMSTPEAAKLLNVKDSTIRDWAKNGKLPCLYLNSLLKFHRRELTAWMLAQYRPVKGQGGTK
jgi:excisionase family DNA binding protein